MTTLTIEQQKALAEKVLPEFTWIINVACNTVVDEDEVYPYIFWPLIDGHDYERSQALAVLGYYAKKFHQPENTSVMEVLVIKNKVTEALRTGDLDPIALEIIGETK